MSAITLERMRADVARMLREAPEAIGLDDNLMDWGLDSLRLLDLITGWNEAGLNVDIMDLAAEASLSGWWRIIVQHQGQ